MKALSILGESPQKRETPASTGASLETNELHPAYHNHAGNQGEASRLARIALNNEEFTEWFFGKEVQP